MKHRAAVRDSQSVRFALLAFFSFAFSYPPCASAQSHTTRTRIHVPDNTPDPALTAARAAMDRKDYAEAVRLYQEYLAKKPDDADAHFDLGNAYASLKQAADAKSEYEKAISLDPKLDVAYVNLGITLTETDPAAAIEPLQKAAALLPDEARPQFLLGWAYERSGKAQLAVEHYRAAENLDEKNSDIHFALGRVLLTSNQPAEAETEFRAAIASDSSNAQAHLGLSQALAAQKESEEAAAELKTYLEAQPNDSEARVSRALALAKLDKNEDALAELDRAAGSNQESLSALRLRGQILFQLKRYDDAISVLEKAAKLAPQDADIRAQIGHVYLEKHAYPNAARELLVAFKMNPQSNDVLGEVVAAEYLGKNYESALKALDLLAQREELPMGTVFIRATCYDKLGQVAQALDWYQKFLQLNKDENNDMYFEATARVRFLTRELKEKKR
ncbi:MAG TPA: tetratricopeptide repeat protein [Candidatus Acidoferrales bacterium]|nr:tetratricopeptide repeat protein [Candidatus Acidoferrales bacterium]